MILSQNSTRGKKRPLKMCTPAEHTQTCKKLHPASPPQNFSTKCRQYILLLTSNQFDILILLLHGLFSEFFQFQHDLLLLKPWSWIDNAFVKVSTSCSSVLQNLSFTVYLSYHLVYELILDGNLLGPIVMHWLGSRNNIYLLSHWI